MAMKNDFALAERQATALRMRAAGASYDEIGRALGCSTATAWRAVRSGLDAVVKEPAQELIMLGSQRLDRLLRAIWPAAIGVIPQPDGTTRQTEPDYFAVDRVLDIMQRRAKLLGLDAPAKKQITGEWVMKSAAETIAAAHGLGPAEVLAEAERLLKGISDE